MLSSFVVKTVCFLAVVELCHGDIQKESLETRLCRADFGELKGRQDHLFRKLE